MNQNTAWFFDQGDERVGPVSLESLREMLNAGTIHPQQIVWDETPERRVYLRANHAVGAAEISFQDSGKAMADQGRVRPLAMSAGGDAGGD
jgi:hypothetical protein